MLVVHGPSTVMWRRKRGASFHIRTTGRCSCNTLNKLSTSNVSPPVPCMIDCGTRCSISSAMLRQPTTLPRSNKTKTEKKNNGKKWQLKPRCKPKIDMTKIICVVSKWVSYAMREILDHGIQMRLEGILCFLYTLFEGG